MDEHQFIECLIHYGLTRQEAIVYHRLLTDGKQTGYEIAKATGISRSNAYSGLYFGGECQEVYSGCTGRVL